MIDRSVIDKLFTVNETLRSAGMNELSNDEIRNYAGRAMQTQRVPQQPTLQEQGMPSMLQSPLQIPQQGTIAPPQMGRSMGGAMMSQSDGSGFDTHIHIGQDGKLKALNIKRVIQNRMQGGMGYGA